VRGGRTRTRRGPGARGRSVRQVAVKNALVVGAARKIASASSSGSGAAGQSRKSPRTSAAPSIVSSKKNSVDEAALSPDETGDRAGRSELHWRGGAPRQARRLWDDDERLQPVHAARREFLRTRSRRRRSKSRLIRPTRFRPRSELDSDASTAVRRSQAAEGGVIAGRGDEAAVAAELDLAALPRVLRPFSLGTFSRPMSSGCLCYFCSHGLCGCGRTWPLSAAVPVPGFLLEDPGQLSRLRPVELLPSSSNPRGRSTPKLVIVLERQDGLRERRRASSCRRERCSGRARRTPRRRACGP